MSARDVERIVVLGGSGDLTMRFLVPALAELDARGALGREVALVGVDRGEISSDDYRARVARALPGHARFASRFEHVTADASDEDALRRAFGEGPALVYVALPPSLFDRVLDALARLPLPRGSRVAMEKPFGVDLASARALNEKIARGFRDVAVSRVDHFLGMPPLRDLRRARVEGSRLEELLSSKRVERVEIVWDETLALEGRATYYDGTGAVRDMVQNHLLQVLALLAMERPANEGPRALAEAKVDVLRRTALRDPSRLERCVVVGQYGESIRDGRRVPAYADEPDVEHADRTETFVELELAVEGDRWRGVPFVLRSGKALARDRMEVALQLREGRRATFTLAEDPARATSELDALFRSKGDGLSAYACVLDALLRGDDTLAVSPEEPEEGFRIVGPVLEAVERKSLPLVRYPAGSDGPRLDAG